MIMAVLSHAATSRVESGEKSTAVTMVGGNSSQCSKTCSYVSASQTITLPNPVPAAIHLPSVETARHRTSPAFHAAIRLPSCTRHTQTPSESPATRWLPFAVNVTAFILLPPSILMSGKCPFQSSALTWFILSVRTPHCRRHGQQSRKSRNDR